MFSNYSLLSRGITFVLFSICIVQATISNVHSQNNLSVPFSSGFVGDVTGNNSAGNCLYMSSLGWSNIYFTQTTSSTVFVAQGNDIIGNIVITDAAGVVHTISGYIKWRAPSGSPTCLVFSPSSTATLAKSSGGTYSVNSGKYLGLIFNGQSLTFSGSNVSGNAATNGLLDVLNSYLAVFPSISIIDYTVNESIGSFLATVTLSQASSSEIRVNYNTSNGTALSGSDYISSSGQLIFSPYQTSKTVTLNVLADLMSESTESFYLNLSGPVNASISVSRSLISLTDNPPLPVELISFGAECENGAIIIQWETASEMNSDYFTVDKKTDDTDWVEAFDVPASGFSQKVIVYSVSDEQLLNENIYYRLNQYDTDGKKRTYASISAHCTKSNADFELFPNPAQSTFQIRMMNSSSTFSTITVMDQNGKVLFTTETFDLKSDNVFNVDANQFGKGIFTVLIENGDIQSRKRIVLL